MLAKNLPFVVGKYAELTIAGRCEWVCNKLHARGTIAVYVIVTKPQTAAAFTVSTGSSASLLANGGR